MAYSSRKCAVYRHILVIKQFVIKMQFEICFYTTLTKMEQVDKLTDIYTHLGISQFSAPKFYASRSKKMKKDTLAISEIFISVSDKSPYPQITIESGYRVGEENANNPFWRELDFMSFFILVITLNWHLVSR